VRALNTRRSQKWLCGLLACVLIALIACERPLLEEESAEIIQVGLVLHPWDTYFSEPPVVLNLEAIPSSVQRLLNEQQRLAKAVLDGHGATPIMEIAPLEARLAELKTMIPDAETRSGYVEHGYRRVGSVYSSDTFSYARTGSGVLYDYPVFRLQNKSSSPELVRSVHGIVHNASINDLEQRIAALQQLTSVWSRRNSVMSSTGSSGLMRSANEAYLQELRGLTREFIELQQQRDAALARHGDVQRNHEQNLQLWQAFETNELPVLQRFFERNTIKEIVCNDPVQNYVLARPGPQHIYILAAPIGPRKLYFPIDLKPSSVHPFVMVELGSYAGGGGTPD
jgi:hypothetical protein